MKKLLKLLLLIVVLYFFLLIPFPKNQVEIQKPSEDPFIWGQDKLWEKLEVSFQNAKEIPSEELDSIIKTMVIESDSLFNENEFVDRFNKLKSLTEAKIKSFKEENDYLPPYWQMVKMAEESLTN